MATEDHKKLANFLKNVHSSLRLKGMTIGVEQAWQEHCNNTEVLNVYAQYMEKLATTYWEENYLDGASQATSRIKWAADYIYEYFINKGYFCFKDKEIEIGKKINLLLKCELTWSAPLKLLDVGSCYNPFKKYDFLDVIAIDLCPANNSVMQCDFLNVVIGSDIIIQNGIVHQLIEDSFDVITFCYVLEYIPDSNLRIQACLRAYNLLKPGGLLIIITPDSKHVGANSKLMKCWRYTLACIGFSRIKYEKFQHMHCMAFRKSLHKDVAARWAHLYKEPFMVFSIHIPQDFKSYENKCDTPCNITATIEDFIELPFAEEC